MIRIKICNICNRELSMCDAEAHPFCIKYGPNPQDWPISYQPRGTDGTVRQG